MNNPACEQNGKLSATRIAFLAWSLGLLLIWGYTSFHQKSLVAIDQSITTILATLTAGKVVQRFGENRNVDKTPPA